MKQWTDQPYGTRSMKRRVRRARRRIAVATVAVLHASGPRRSRDCSHPSVSPENGQLDARYWSIFTRYTTWRFLGNGLVRYADGCADGRRHHLLRQASCSCWAASAAFKVLRAWLCTALIEFSRGVPTLLFIYFFLLVVPQFGIRLPALWKVAAPVAISACGCCGRSTPLRCQCRTERSDGSGTLTRHAQAAAFFSRSSSRRRCALSYRP